EQHPGPFDAIVATSLPSAAGQLSYLASRRELLASHGILCVGVRNRIGWDRLRRRDAGSTRGGLRTYAGYVRLFAAAGYSVRSAHVSPGGGQDPTELVPLQRQAIAHY